MTEIRGNAGRREGVRAVVDHDLCAGVTQCLQMAPSAFRLDGEQLSVFAPSGPWTLDELVAARDGCPMAAITIVTSDYSEDTADGQQAPFP
jgi:ferredoxin